MRKSVAFKCTYNDGGEDVLVGFSDTCSKANIIRNVQNSRVWCSSLECACRRYYDKGRKGHKPQEPCYESVLFREWRYGGGAYHTGVRAGTPIPLNDVEFGKFAILTTRFPDEHESERRIVGLFQIGKIEDNPETVVIATPESRIRLPLEEAKELYFWAYLDTKTGRPDWRTGLFRYLEDEQVHRILADVAETARDENTRATVKKLIAQEFGTVSPPSATGCLPERSINRSLNIAQARKYGPGGEGRAHKKLKMWLSEHPDKIGLTNIEKVEVEHRFLSGDLADLVFAHEAGRYTVVKVETNDSLPGAHQAIKYRALLCAEKNFSLDTDKVKAVLVAWEIPDEVKVFCEKYEIGFETYKL
jgi:hypothetical protein